MLENSELSDIFQSVEYEPKEIELEVNLKCFIPDYIPALDTICLHLQV